MKKKSVRRSEVKVEKKAKTKTTFMRVGGRGLDGCPAQKTPTVRD